MDETKITKKFIKIKEFYDNGILNNNIFLIGNNSYKNNIFLDKLINLLFGDVKLKKIEGIINLYSCKYFIKFEAKNIINTELIDCLKEFIFCRNVIDMKKIFIIYNYDTFNDINKIYIKNIAEKHKIILIGSSVKNIDNIHNYKIIVPNIITADDKLKYDIYYNLLDNYYKKINNQNFISYTDQLSKQLNKYLYDFSFFIKVCFNYFKSLCDKYKLLEICCYADKMIHKNYTKTIYLNDMLFQIFNIIEY